ncbi:MAG: NAD(P)/FAD-dependent oxidoreductase [Acidobacteriia bacterium]|nr:NAD(P)/FAD-dependent oxidoreductase [Terriglobia bacterium]
MPHARYLIVGGGMAGEAAIHGIREADREGSVALFGTEPDPPYDRPPLSKGLWKDKPVESVWRDTEGLEVGFHLGRTVVSLDPGSKSATDDAGAVHTFDKLLLATGGAPRRLPFGGDRINYFRTLQDYRELRALADRGRRFAVIGGGFIGSEIAAALAMNGKDVTMIFPQETIGARVFPHDLGLFLNSFYAGKGVTVLPGQTAARLEPQGDRLSLEVHPAGSPIRQAIGVDGVVAGIGIRPLVELAQAAGLEVDGGIVVDETLRTSHGDIYAAGDVASFHSPVLGKRIRVEHEDNANTMGRAAGRAMAGSGEPYRHLPFFYSDLFELGYEAVGEIDSRLEIVADWKEPHREGVVYYLRSGRVRGVLLWNVWEQVEAARRLIAEPGPFRPADLRGRLPEAR